MSRILVINEISVPRDSRILSKIRVSPHFLHIWVACRDSLTRWSSDRSLVAPSRSATLRSDVSIRFGSSFGRRETAARLNVAVTCFEAVNRKSGLQVATQQ